jgi:hypothetical protein
MAQETKHFQVPEFLSAEDMGVDLPGGAPRARPASAISFKEVQEYQVILEGSSSMRRERNGRRHTRSASLHPSCRIITIR